jgi:polyadenylation factor subunit 2
MTSIPVLLPPAAISSIKPADSSRREWTPTKYLSPLQPPVQDDSKIQEMEMAAARQFMDGKAIKKTRPRRTVDYNGGMGRWVLVRGALNSWGLR